MNLTDQHYSEIKEIAIAEFLDHSHGRIQPNLRFELIVEATLKWLRYNDRLKEDKDVRPRK